MAVTTDLARIAAILQRERPWSAFALADLEPPHSGFCEWHVTPGDTALVLIYRGFDPPLFFSTGPEDQVATLLADIAGEAHLYLSVRGGLADRLTAAGYFLHNRKMLYRMLLQSGVTLPRDPRAEHLEAGDYDALVTLYEDGDASGERPPFFQRRSLESGVYYGVREGGRLAAAAGTLVFAPQQSVACLGNVYVRRDCRGRGLGSFVTAAVTSELASRGIGTIALNVVSDNAPAIRIYERLGFSRYCEYEEARAVHCRTVTV